MLALNDKTRALEHNACSDTRKETTRRDMHLILLCLVRDTLHKSVCPIHGHSSHGTPSAWAILPTSEFLRVIWLAWTSRCGSAYKVTDIIRPGDADFRSWYNAMLKYADVRQHRWMCVRWGMYVPENSFRQYDHLPGTKCRPQITRLESFLLYKHSPLTVVLGFERSNCV